MVASVPVLNQEPIEEPVQDPINSLLTALASIRTRSAQLQYQANAQETINTLEYRKEEFVECFAQNVNQIETLLKSKKEEKEEKGNEGRAKVFDFNETKYKKGQWVDVKSTTGHWVEAQITEVEESRVLVRFNGRGATWDEWIEYRSPRISLFRSHTIQSPNSIFNSLYPQLPPDNKLQDTIDFNTSFKSFTESTESLQRMMKSYTEQKEEKNGTRQVAQIAPLLDRIGRVMIDLSKHFASVAYKEQCTGNEVIRIPRLPASNDSPLECQIALTPSPSELSVVRDSQRENSNVIHVQQIILSHNEPSASGVENEVRTGNVTRNNPATEHNQEATQEQDIQKKNNDS